MNTIQGNLVDVFNRRIFPAIIQIQDGKIVEITEVSDSFDSFIIPGFVDAHIHIESSMLVPTEFARIALKHGTIATVSDPHEIANVLGVPGIDYMIENASHSPLQFFFGLPSCVPASPYETSGAIIDADQIENLIQRPDLFYLAEMMNFPGVLKQDEQVIRKINAAKNAGKMVDGHAPGLQGKEAEDYFRAGIATDHECFTLEEARYKAKLGVHILIREGSAAKNYSALSALFHEFPHKISFCSDDKHPGDLIQGHINQLAARAVRDGFDVFDVIKAASTNTIQLYKLPLGMLRINDSADFIVVHNVTEFIPKQTWIGGKLVFDGTHVYSPSIPISTPNVCLANPIVPADIHKPVAECMHVITCENGQLITGECTLSRDEFEADSDIVKIIVLNRYKCAPPAVGYIKNTGLKRGAIASSVTHDSHNIIAIGADDDAICAAVNCLINQQGGLSAVLENQSLSLKLSVAGLMSEHDVHFVTDNYQKLIDFCINQLGVTLHEPFMTLSFMALTVIPELKMSDLGLFRVSTGKFVH